MTGDASLWKLKEDRALTTCTGQSVPAYSVYATFPRAVRAFAATEEGCVGMDPRCSFWPWYLNSILSVPANCILCAVYDGRISSNIVALLCSRRPGYCTIVMLSASLSGMAGWLTGFQRATATCGGTMMCCRDYPPGVPSSGRTVAVRATLCTGNRITRRGPVVHAYA